MTGGRGWIRTIEAESNRFTVCPLWPLGNSSIFSWSWWTDLNPWPADYKSAALPTELHQHSSQRSYKQTKLVNGLEPLTCWLQISCSTNWATPASNRGDRSRTCGILVPNQALYQTELRLVAVLFAVRLTAS